MNKYDRNSDWKIHIPEKNMYIMKDHSWAFIAWELERIKGSIRPDAVLLHLDYHLDDVADGLFVDGIMTAKSEDDLFKLIRTREELNSGNMTTSKICIDNFIWPSFARGTVGSMFTVAPQQQQDLATWMLSDDDGSYQREDIENNKQEILGFISEQKFKSVYRSYNIEQFKESHLDTFIKCSEDKSKILDIDLDYFNKSQNLFAPDLMPEKEIRSILHDVMKMCKWDLVTVALSPIYCGGDEKAEYLLKIFADVTELERI
ncbi:UPF0489 family protein [Fictibacillus sp. KIGAM418]|uniref:UPF0489 family protein n=1 Tax=Fictibacillus marinisediminis TaxID=2878389 RepID=A0A9X1XEM0_9BACL|nr:UPF0489 family protein [Fictibacillus marinisediminis]MCK6259517.1 UPF0489 family protein [Fictibacillus marinisediminis]